MDTPLVSVIIPTYNRCQYLRMAIHSVLSQSYKNFEVIIVDDGSTDSTESVVTGIPDPRIHYIYQENQGRSNARNHGMASANGVYLAFLDDDDLYLPDKLACQVTFLETHPDIDLVASGLELVDEQGIRKGIWFNWQDSPNLTFLNCLFSCPLLPSVVLFRTRIIDDLDQWFDEDMNLLEDTDFFLRLLLSGHKMEWVTEIVSAYRIHNNSSQWDGESYSHAHQILLNKVFSKPSLPYDVQADRTKIYAHHHLIAACHSYARGQIESAQEDLCKALELDPEMLKGFPAPFGLQIANFANSFQIDNPRTYIYNVFNNLPIPYNFLCRYRRDVFSFLYMGRVFKSSAAGIHPSLRDWLKGVFYGPRWLQNRGVWSMLIRYFIGDFRIFNTSSTKYG